MYHITYFYPRSPCGERRQHSAPNSGRTGFLSTLSLRRATGHEYNIVHNRYDFYPRSPCGERRQPGNRRAQSTEFLSTLSLRRATHGRHGSFSDAQYFYPRSPCGERRQMLLTRFFLDTFLSTLSLRRATVVDFPRVPNLQISIHALLAESDASHFMPNSGTLHFYPRSPCGERLAGPSGPAFLFNFYPRSPCGERPNLAPKPKTKATEFLSTLSLRRATNGHEQAPYIVWISIHALLAESDIMFVNLRVVDGSFLSTLSLRRATATFC